MDHTKKDLFPALVTQLSRETSGTPLVHLDSLVARANESTTPVGFVDPVTSAHLTGDGNISDTEPALPVPNPPIPSGSTSATLRPLSSPESTLGDTSRHITDQALVTPVRPTRVRFSIGETSQPHLPVASSAVPCGDNSAFTITSNRRSTDTAYANARRLKDALVTTPRLKLIVNKPHDAAPHTRTGSKSANAEIRPKDVTPVTTTRLKLVVNKPPEATPDSSQASDSTTAKKPPKNATPMASRKRKAGVNKRARRSILGSNPIVPPNPVSNEFPSSSAKPGEQSASIDSDQLKPTTNTSLESSFVLESNMDLPKSTTFSSSQGPFSDYNEASTSINLTSELAATTASPKTRSSSDEAPFGYSGYRSPLRDYVFSTPPDPSMDPNQPSSAVMSGITPFEDPNVLPSTFMYPEEAPDNSNWTTDPLGVYTPEQFERIMASEQEVLREMAGPHADPPDAYAWEEQRRMRKYLTPDGLAAEMKADVDVIEAANADDERLQPRSWDCSGFPQPYPAEPDAPEPSLAQHPSPRLDSDEPTHTDFSSTQATSPGPRETSEGSSQTLKSVEETYQTSAMKRARHSSHKTKSSTPDVSITSPRTSVPAQRRSISSRVTKTPPSTSTSILPRRSSRIGTKAELSTPEHPVTVSTRRLRSSDVNPSSSTKKIGKGNATPDSWETAPIADKMMSQMKETTMMSWMEITTAWNNNRSAEHDIMTWRALAKRWIRIKEKIGVWPGFDEVLLEHLRQSDSELDSDAFLQIAELVSVELGWEISAAVCQGRYEFFKESGQYNLKGKGKTRK